MMNCNIKLNLRELEKLGKVLESIYNSRLIKKFPNDFKSSNFDYANLVLKSSSNCIDDISNIMVLMDRLHKVHQYYLGDTYNEYNISVNLLETKKKVLRIHRNNLNELIDHVNSTILKRDDVNYINDLKNQCEAIEVAINKLDEIKDKLMSREIIELDEILDIDELC